MTSASCLFSIMMPFALIKQADGGWVMVNREYKPIGFPTNEFVRYEEFPVSHKCKITPAQLKKLDIKGVGGNFIYLYGGVRQKPYDCPKEMAEYTKKLVLMSKIFVRYQ